MAQHSANNGMPGQRELADMWGRAEGFYSKQYWPEAEDAFLRIHRLRPEQPMPLLRLSTVATRRGKYRKASEFLLMADATPFNHPELRLLVASLLHRVGETRRAGRSLERIELEKAEQSTLESAAVLANQLELPEQTLRICSLSARRFGQSANTLHQSAVAQLFLGETSCAIEALEECLRMEPGHAPAWWALTKTVRATTERNHLDSLERALAATTDATQPSLAFALAKQLDDLGQTDRAWKLLARGCEVKRKQLSYDVSQEVAAFEVLMSQCDSAFLSETAEPRGGPQPIFVVGMPRTGSTLLERMLGSHPQVRSAGELDDFPLQMRWVTDQFAKSFLDPAVFRRCAGADFELLGHRYLEQSQWRARGRDFYIDKLPLNFLNIGYIHKALPGARIVHITRNPLDTCFSNLRELFAEAYPYSYDFAELASYYGRYRRLMDHWHAHLPGRILEVRYEDLVADPRSVMSSVLGGCGLPWDERCQHGAGNAEIAATASASQVRERLHKRGLDNWKRYERQLEPLIDMLRREGWLEAEQ